MTLAEKLIAARASIVGKKDQLTALAQKENPTAEDVLQMDELSGQIEKEVSDAAVIERAEKALAMGSKPVTAGNPAANPVDPAAAAGKSAPTAPALGLRGLGRNTPKGFDLLVRSALVTYEAYCNREPIDGVMERRYPGDMQVQETAKLMVAGLVNKSTVNPAFTNVAGWAQELVRDTYGAFMDALRPESIVPRIPMQSYEFDNFGRILIPTRSSTYPDTPNLSGAFRAEGAPIRVGRTTLSSKILTPKSMGVIGTFTRELLKRSTPNIEDAIRQWMLEDTAMALDVVFLDNVAGDLIRPAGIRNGILAQDTRASLGNTAQDITNDIQAMLTGLSNRNMGRRPVWVMNQARAWGVAFSRTPTGDSAFPGMEGGTGTLAGIPVVASVSVPLNVLLLIDSAELAFAGGAPVFEGTDVATVHEDDSGVLAGNITGPDVRPIVGGTNAAPVPAAPVRSLWQTNSAALKATWEIDWTVARVGAVQELTGVAWGTP